MNKKDEQTMKTYTLCIVAVLSVAMAGCKPRSTPVSIDGQLKRKTAEPASPVTNSAIRISAIDANMSLRIVMDSYDSIYMTSNIFLHNLSLIDDGSDSYRVMKYVKQCVIPYVFASANTTRLDNVFEQLVRGRKEYGNSSTGGVFGWALRAIRYRALLPYVRDALQSDSITNDTTRAMMCISLLRGIAHADALSTWWEIERKLPADSPLRKGRMPLWSGNMPLFKRNDCLEVYMDMVHHPEQYDFNTWYATVEMLPVFTNASAVAALQFSLKAIKDPGKYWPGMKPSLYIWSVDEKIKTQQEYVQGKRGPINMDRDKPFDE